MKGFDISGHQATISLLALKDAGFRFGFLKATEGRSFVDPAYARHRIEAMRVGIPVGAYHYARPDTDIPLGASWARVAEDAVAEADFFLRVAAPKKNDLRPVLDFEETSHLGPDKMLHWARRFLERVEQAVEEPPFLYTFPAFWRGEMNNISGLGRFPLWLAFYGRNTDPGDAEQYPLSGHFPLGDWTKVAIHQYTSKGQIAGWAGRTLDFNSTRPLYSSGNFGAEIDLGVYRLGLQPTELGPDYGPPWKIVVGGELIYEGKWTDEAKRLQFSHMQENPDVIVRGTRKLI